MKSTDKIFAAGLALAIGVALIAVAYGDGPQSEDVAGGRVIGLRGYPIAAQNPTDGQVLTYSATPGVYAPATPTSSGGSGITGLTNGQVGVAGSATTLTSSVPFGLTGNSTIVETTSGGLLTPSILPLATNAAIGGMRGDGSTISCVAGVCTAAGGSTGLSGMTATQLAVAASATTVTSSVPVSATSGSNTVVETGAGGKIASGYMTGVLACADLTNGATGCSTTVGTIATQNASAVTIAGGTLADITGFGLRDTSAAFDLTLAAVSSTALSAGRTLTFDVVNAARTLKLGSNLTIATDPGAVTGALKSNGTGTFAQAACADLSNGATGCSTATGTSGATIPLLNGTNTWSAGNGFTTISASGQITSTVTTGTAPLVVASTTNVANLNASSLGGATMAAPGAIGGGTPGSAAHTTISATGQITSTLATGTAPFVVASTTNVANLNASTLTGSAVGTSGATIGLLNANKTDSGTNSFTGVNNTFTAMAGVVNTLTISTATFTPALASGVNQAATLVHASCPCTMANPSDTSSHIGQTGVLVVTQSSTGSDTVGTWGSQYVTPGGVSTLTLSTAANAVDYLPYYVADATHVVLGTLIKGPTH